jgi:hypothetical protein
MLYRNVSYREVIMFALYKKTRVKHNESIKHYIKLIVTGKAESIT